MLTKGCEETGFPVPDLSTSGLHVCNRNVSIYCVRKSWRLCLQDFFVSNSQSKQNRINSKLLCSHCPSFLLSRPCRPRKTKRDIETRMLYLFLTWMRKTYPISDQTGYKITPFGAVHTFTPYIREQLPTCSREIALHWVDCSQSPIFPWRRRDRSFSPTGATLVHTNASENWGECKNLVGNPYGGGMFIAWGWGSGKNREFCTLPSVRSRSVQDGGPSDLTIDLFDFTEK